ncbi:MAG: sulfite exporter TauE/SafE family protein [Pseudomonadales bacterium]|nr:sulfite exporter TauE/SafE family protein [Pseudomonadales bacterium]
MTPIEVGLLVTVGTLSGFINTLAGGGSMLTLPALMMLGIPADIANGTNRVAVLAQSITGAKGFDQAGQLDRSALARVLLPTILGAAVGALCASVLPNVWLKPILLVVMVMVALSLLLPKTAATQPHLTSSVSQTLGLAAWLSLFGAGLYGGFIQAGVGFILVAVLSGVLRYDMVRSNALKLVCTGVFSGVALLIFAAQGQVLWLTGGVLALGSMLGAWLSVRVTIRLSETVLRRILVIMVAICCLAALLV